MHSRPHDFRLAFAPLAGRPFRALRSIRALGVCAGLAFTGCYTQFATRSQDVAAPAYPQDADSAWSSAAGDRITGSPAAQASPGVIVNNYYDPRFAYHDPRFVYRGYSHWEWTYPTLAFGLYSAQYGHYSRPYWWDSPRYRHPHPYGNIHRPPRGPDGPPPPSGPYQSDKRLYSPGTAYPNLQKGRRSEPPAPVPQPPPQQAAPQPAPKSGGASPAQPAGDSGKAEKEAPSDDDGGYRSLKKGRRR